MARLLVKPCYCFGAPDIKERLLEGVELNGRSYKNDGYNLLDYLSGKTDTPPRNAFIYVNEAAEVIAIRVGDWKAVYHENRARQLDWGADRSFACACRCSSTCGAIRSSGPRRTRTPVTTG